MSRLGLEDFGRDSSPGNSCSYLRR